MTTRVFYKQLILVGGGHTHTQVMRLLGMRGGIPGVRVTVISDQSTAYYSGMLPGCLAGMYAPDEIRVDLGPLARWAGVQFIRALVIGVDPRLQQILLEDRPSLSYDVLSINIGSVSRGMDTPGVREYATSTRPLWRLIDRVEAFERSVSNGSKPLRVVVVGSGAAGVELSFAMRLRWAKRFGDVSVTLIDGGADLLAGRPIRVRDVTRRRLRENGIAYRCGSYVERVDATTVSLKNDEVVDYDFLLWATGGAAPSLLANTGLETDENGFIRVGPTLQTIHYPSVFGAGDCIHFSGNPLPKAGVYAVREGPVLTENIIRFFKGQPMTIYRPQRHFLALLLSGDREAIGSWRSLAPHGRWMWSLKDWIDRKWMLKFEPTRLPVMTQSQLEVIPDALEPMRCGGCGSKVGSSILTGVLTALETVPNRHVIIGLAQADDGAVLRFPPGASVVQTIDGFRAFIDDLYLFGRIALIHAASDLYAMGANPDSALVAVTLPYAAKSLVADDLRQIMEGVAVEARRLGITLIGGHTSEGAETAIVLAVNGLLATDVPFTKSGLATGDYLILTKPLGVGVVLAGEMRLQTKGAWMDGAMASMLMTNRAAAGIFRSAGVRSVTDITGFGMAGHLVEMLDASGVGAIVAVSAIPTLRGSRELLNAGVHSTLAPSNREHVGNSWEIDNHVGAYDELLYDPQTSGGLLGGVPEREVEKVLQELRAAGYLEAAVIGRVTDTPGRLILENQVA